MKPEKALAALAALAQESRLAVYLLLLEEENGVIAGDIAARLDIPLTTLSFHLNQLKHAGLVTSEKNGRFVIYHANRKKAKKLGQYITGKNTNEQKDKKYQL